MSTPTTDHNLLFGVLALQADFLTPTQFVEACSLWATQKSIALAELLVQRGWLTADDRADVERLLVRKIAKHGGNVQAGLAEVTTDSVRNALAGVPDAEVQASMAPPEPPGNLLISTVALIGEQTSDRYTITRLHATGGIGRVWLARDGALGRDVALKELRPDRSQDAVAARFLKEARITGQLEHPGIVPVYELGHRPSDNQPFYTMRFVRGRTLREAIKAYHQKREEKTLGPLDFRDLLTAFLGVCNAIGYAHSRGVIHRDLKPANVVLGDYGEVMVLDWGLAKVVADGPEADSTEPPLREQPAAGENPTIQGQVLGTPAYMAPEQADGRLDQIDNRTDIYGLGAVLYEILTGHPPFDGQNTEDVLNHVRHLTPLRPRTRVRETPLPLEAVCLKCLHKRPADRYATTKELAADIQRFLADEPVSAYREPVVVRARRWARRHRTLVSSGVVALLVAVPILVTGLVLLQQSGKREREARERAQANYHRALQSGDLMAGELARGVRPVAGTQRKTVIEILDRASQVYDDLLSDPSPPREALEGRGRTLVLFAELYRETNQSERAKEAANRAIAVYDRLLTDQPGEPSYRIGRGTARHRRAWVLYDQGYYAESLIEFRACVQELEECHAEDDPHVAATTLGSAHTFSGNLYLSLGNHAEARKHYAKGFGLRQRGVAANPTDPDIRSGLGLSLEKYGAFLFLAGTRDKPATLAMTAYAGTSAVFLVESEKEEARNMMRRACRENETLARADPWNSELHLHWIRSLNTLAQNLTEGKEEKKRVLDEARTIADRFARVDPEHITWQREAYRAEHLRKELEAADWTSLTREERAKMYRGQLDVSEAIVAATIARNRVDPDNYLWLADTANLEARGADSCLSLLRFVDDPGDLLQLARSRVTSSLADYDRVLQRCPDNQDWRMGKIYALYIKALVEAANDQHAAAFVAHWNYLTEAVSRDQQMVKRYPGDPLWTRALKRDYSGFVFGFTPSGQGKYWPDVAAERGVVDALLACCRAVANQTTDIPEEFRESYGIARRMGRKHLEQVDKQGLLPAEGKDLLARLQD
jgi:serine/threonine protein kinase